MSIYRGTGPDRRQVLLGGTAATIVLGMGRTAQAQEPKKGGHFRLGVSLGNVGDSHDPATWGTSTVINVGLWGAVYNNLTEVDPTGQLVPQLAESFEPTPDAKEWTFRLRKGVTFHNGKTLDARDVVASFNHHRDEANGSAAHGIVEQIADIRTEGDDVVIFELKDGNADFPFMCTDYHLVIGAADADGKIDWENPVGTGGYEFVSHERGVRMTLRRNRNYWRDDRAHFDDVDLFAIADNAARMNALVTGEVDAIARVDIKSMALLRRSQDIVIDEVTGTQHFTMPMFCDVAPFNDLNVRLALKHAVDREAMVQTILRGHGRPGNDSPITPANRYFADDIPQRTYDPDKARFHLREAGIENLRVDLSAADAAFAGAVDTAILFQEHARAAGIEINVVREPNDGYWSNVWTKKPFVMSYWAGRPTEDWMFSQVYASEANWNDAHWKNERFDQLLLQARAELDESLRREMYREMQLLVRDDGGTIIPMYANYVDARNSRIAHSGTLGPNFELDGWKCIERWWMA